MTTQSNERGLVSSVSGGASTSGNVERLHPWSDWPNVHYSQHCQAGGLDWHLQRHGAGTRVLLLHGTGAATHSWRDLFPLLAEDHEVLAPDLPGHGFTTRDGNSSQSLEGMSGRLAALLKAQNFMPDVVVGHSAGAAIGLRMVLDGQIEPGLMVGINAALLPFGGSFSILARPLAKLMVGTSFFTRVASERALRPGSVERLINNTGSRLTPQAMSEYRRLLSRESHVSATLAMMAHWDLHGLLDSLPSTPLCLVVGENDQTVSPQQASRIQERAKRSRVIRLAGLGHLAHEEDPRAVFSAIIDACVWSGVDAQ